MTHIHHDLALKAIDVPLLSILELIDDETDETVLRVNVNASDISELAYVYRELGDWIIKHSEDCPFLNDASI